MSTPPSFSTEPAPSDSYAAPQPSAPQDTPTPSAGEPNAEQPNAEQPYAGQPYPAQQYSAQQYSGQPSSGQQYPGQPSPGQPSPGQPSPAQQHPGQPYAGQPYPAQQHPAPPATNPYDPAPPAAAPGYPQDGPAYNYGPAYGYGAPVQPTNGLAIASLVCSLAAFIIWITAPVGLILGIIALRTIKQDGTQGHGMALAGTIVGGVLTGFGVLVAIFYLGFFALAIGSAGFSS